MTLYADPHRCPDCRGSLVAGSTQCPSCGLQLGGPLARELFVVLGRADVLLTRLRQEHARPILAEQVTSPPERVPDERAPVVRTSSVPKILLGLGAVCVLVAALVFLAVTWALLGVGGRTAVLVGLTVATGACTAWVARRDLRGATEALGAVTIGLAVLDAVGARGAGWLGDPTVGTFTAFLGGLLVVGGLGATQAVSRTPVRQLVVGETAVVVGTLLVAAGLVDGTWSTYAVRPLVAMVTVALVTALAWKLDAGVTRLRVAAWGTTGVTTLSWLAFFAAGLAQLGSEPTTASVWGRLEGWPLLAAGLAAAAVVALPRLPVATRVGAAGAALVPVAVVGTAPAYDESTTVLTSAVLVAVALAAAVMTLAPRPWGAGALGATFLGSTYLVFHTLVMLGTAVGRYADVADRGWRGTSGGRLAPLSEAVSVGEPWLLPMCGLVLIGVLWATMRLVDPSRRPATPRTALAAATVLSVAVVCSLLLSTVPVWTLLAAILALAVAAAGLFLRGAVSELGAVVSGGALAAAVPLSLFDERLTAASLTVTLVLLATAHLRSGSVGVVLVAGALAGPVVAGMTWTVGAIVVADRPWLSLTGLVVLATVALGRSRLPSALRSTAVLASVEAGAALGALALAVGGVAAADGPADWTAVYLTVTGATATVLALLRDDRRPVGWLGGVLLVLATWVRLDDIGVQEPEPYTLPSAVALLVVAWVHLRRHPASSTLKALGPGLALGLVPSLLWVLDDPLGVRALLLGLTCLVLVVVGAQLRLAAPLAFGAGTGLLVVLREAAPFVGESVPRWALIGAAGVLLIGLGLTWEQRMHQARTAAGYLRRMR